MQSSAALVAIVGGLLVTRLVGATAERSALAQRDRELLRANLANLEQRQLDANRFGETEEQLALAEEVLACLRAIEPEVRKAVAGRRERPTVDELLEPASSSIRSTRPWSPR